MPNISFVGAKKRKVRHFNRVFRMSRQEIGITQLGLAPHGLLSLVDELLLNIIDQIDARDTLCNLAATCTRFQGLAEPYIWHTLLVLRGLHSRAIAAAIDSHNVRAEYIRTLSIRYRDEVKEGIEELNHFIGLMSKLRHLTIESPCPNNLEWRSGVFFDGWSRIDYTNLLAGSVYPRQGLPTVLPMLQSITLHGHGSGDSKFSLGRAKAMFFHPTLRSITVSCLDFDDAELRSDNVPEANRMSSPLQSLTLIECNVNVAFLDAVLSLPKALKELSIGERLHVFPECPPLMDPKSRTSSALFLSALYRQAHSLERLTHIGGVLGHQYPRELDDEGSFKMRSFFELHYLELGFESNLYFYLRNNGFPPSLRTLKMLDAAISLSSGHDLRSLIDIIFRSLVSLTAECLPKTLSSDFTLHLQIADNTILRMLIMRDNIDEQNHLLCTEILDRPSTYKIANLMKSHDSHFRISREVFRSSRYIPPYMYGEDPPFEDLIYDSRDFWKFNGINFRVMDDPQLRSEMKEKKMLFACMRCQKDGLDCINLGDGTTCLSCRSLPGNSAGRCKYEKDKHGKMIPSSK